VRLGRAAQAALQCAGINFLVNCGARAGQVVPHVHLHVVPRYADDAIHWPWPQCTLDKDAAAGLVTAIRERMAQG
jgi:histidine triad (HIT) family protein